MPILPVLQIESKQKQILVHNSDKTRKSRNNKFFKFCLVEETLDLITFSYDDEKCKSLSLETFSL